MRAFVIAAAAVLLSVSAAAFDLPTPREQGMGRTLLLSEGGALTVLRAPTFTLNEREWTIEAGGVRRFEIGDLDEVMAAGAYRYRRLCGAVGIGQFGDADLYAETTVQGMVGYQIGRFGMGLNWSGRWLRFGGGYQGLNAATVGLSLSYRIDRLYVAMVGDNLTRPRLYDGGIPYGRTTSLYAEWRGEGAYQLTGSAIFEEEQTPRFGLGQRFELAREAAVFWGVATDPLTWGAGIDIMKGGARVTYAASYHPVLKLTHALSVGYGSGGRR